MRKLLLGVVIGLLLMPAVKVGSDWLVPRAWAVITGVAYQDGVPRTGQMSYWPGTGGVGGFSRRTYLRAFMHAEAGGL